MLCKWNVVKCAWDDNTTHIKSVPFFVVVLDTPSFTVKILLLTLKRKGIKLTFLLLIYCRLIQKGEDKNKKKTMWHFSLKKETTEWRLQLWKIQKFRINYLMKNYLFFQLYVKKTKTFQNFYNNHNSLSVHRVYPFIFSDGTR